MIVFYIFLTDYRARANAVDQAANQSEPLPSKYFRYEVSPIDYSLYTDSVDQIPRC